MHRKMDWFNNFLLSNKLMVICLKLKFNTLTSGLIQAVCKKTAGSHVALRENISAPVSVTDLIVSVKRCGKSCS